MQLIVWRHAHAREGSPDLARELTDRGREQARAMAAWLAPRLPQGARLIASPALRSQQTARALREPDLIDARIAPEADLDEHLAAIGSPVADADRALVLVGHQPGLGRLVSHLLAGQPLDWRMRKGAIWWLATRARDGHARFWLRAVIDPDTL